MFSSGMSTSTRAATKVQTATIPPRTKPPALKASSSSDGEAGEESWSSIERWNFCCSSDDELLAKAFVAQAIMISPGMMKTT